jgi:hypothetical protein
VGGANVVAGVFLTLAPFVQGEVLVAHFDLICDL